MNFLGYFIYWAPPLRDFGIFLSGFFLEISRDFQTQIPIPGIFRGFRIANPVTVVTGISEFS